MPHRTVFSTLLSSLLIANGLNVIFTPMAFAAESSADEESIEVIRVVGERIPRTLSETASSVFVDTPTSIKSRAGGDNVDDFLLLIPNVHISGNQNNGPTLRGQNSTGVLSGVNAFFGGSRQRSTILLDGRPLSFNEFIYGQTSVWDVEQIEVFLGPQTTSQGPDSIAGAIYVNTKDPHYSDELALRAIGGNYNTYQFSGTVNTALVDNEVAVRASVDYRNHDSFVHYAFAEEDIGADRTEDSYKSGRIKLLWEPDHLPALTSLLTYSFNETQGPQSENIQPPFDGRTRTVPGVSAFGTTTHAIVHDVSYTLNNAVTLSNRLTYANADIDRLAPLGQGVSQIERDEITNEFLVSYSPKDNQVNGVAGIYLQSFDTDEAINLDAFLLGDGAFTDKVTAVGVFGELTYPVSDRLFITGGLRYQEASQDRDGGFAALPPVNFDETFDEWLPKIGAAYAVNETTRVGIEARKGFNPGGVTLSFFTGQLDTFDEETLWNYETYVRSTFLDGRLQLQANLFYTDFDNAQRPVNIPVAGGVITELAQAENAKSYGTELQLTLKASSALTISGAVGLLNTELTEVSLDPTQEGNEFERAPSYSASLLVDYQVSDELKLNFQGRYTDDYFSDDTNAAVFRVNGFFLADVSASYRFSNTRVFAYITNLFDEFNTIQQFGPGTAVVTDPREWGIGVEYFF